MRWAVCCIVILQTFCLLEASKYSFTANKDQKDDGRKFRIHKVHLVWEKAKKKLSGKDLERLYTDLLLQDKLELQAKKAAAAGTDQEGDQQALARKHLLGVLHTYGLDKHFDHLTSNNLDDKPRADTDYDSNFKNDEKLNRLWKKAKAVGYTENELALLMKEFNHYQEKKKEYHLLKTEVYSLLDIHENSIHGHLLEDDDWKSMKNKKKKLKEKHRDLKNHYESLELKTDQPGALKAKFEEPKVVELWALALRANFTEEDLASLKEELLHFEHKVKKQKYLEEQVDISGAAFRHSGKTNDLPGKHVEMEEKLRSYSYKVKKYHHELKSKIAKAYGRHTEL